MKKTLTTMPVTQENLLPIVNRELIPYVRQITQGVELKGSRSTGTAMANLISVLQAAGIIGKDSTTP